LKNTLEVLKKKQMAYISSEKKNTAPAWGIALNKSLSAMMLNQ